MGSSKQEKSKEELATIFGRQNPQSYGVVWVNAGLIMGKEWVENGSSVDL